jgi:hypothetical protein
VQPVSISWSVGHHLSPNLVSLLSWLSSPEGSCSRRRRPTWAVHVKIPACATLGSSSHKLPRRMLMCWALHLATAMMYMKHSHRGSAGREGQFPCYVGECHDESKPVCAHHCREGAHIMASHPGLAHTKAQTSPRERLFSWPGRLLSQDHVKIIVIAVHLSSV